MPDGTVIASAFLLEILTKRHTFEGKAGKTIVATPPGPYLAFPFPFVKVSQESSYLDYLSVACISQGPELASFYSRPIGRDLFQPCQPSQWNTVFTLVSD